MMVCDKDEPKTVDDDDDDDTKFYYKCDITQSQLFLGVLS